MLPGATKRSGVQVYSNQADKTMDPAGQETALRYEVTDRGVQVQDGNKYPTYRIELLDKESKPSDIWSECWLVGERWVCSNERIQCDTLMEALSVGFQSLLEYSGFDEL
jgi:hypothetical protein